MRRSVAAAGLAVGLAAAAAACRERAAPSVDPGSVVRAKPGPERRLMGLIPDSAPAGVVFQRQPDGRAGLAVVGMGFTKADVVHWDGRHLDTMFSSSRLLTVPIDADLLERPGDHAVTIESSVDPSEPKLEMTFRILPPVTPSPAGPPPAGR